MNYEIIYDSVKNRNTIKPQSEIEIKPYPGECYISMFGFDHSIYDWVNFNKSVSGFNGSYFCNYLYFDIDNENTAVSLDVTKELVQALYRKLNVNPKQLFISFSGNKGFHIGLHKNLFGGFEAANNLPKLIQILAGKIVAACFDTTLEAIDKEQVKGSFRSIDLGIYNANRIFRVINSCNAKSQLYKIGIYPDELFSMNIEQIKDMAVEPRLDYKLQIPLAQLTPNENLVHLLADAKKFDPAAYTKALNKSTESNGGDFFTPPATGNRNQELFKQACMLFDHSEFNETSVRQIISSINQGCEQPLPEDEIKTLVHSAAKRTAKNAKENVLVQATESLETFYPWFDEWVDYYTAERKKLTSLFDDIDRDNEYNYAGKVACIIGKGGSRKSYYVQNLLAENILNHNARVLYSSMEMGKVEVVNRLLDIICEPSGEKVSASHELKTLVKQDKATVKTHIREVMKHVDERLILSNNAFLEPADYEKLLQKTFELYGSVDMLVIDGLSAMGGKGTETEVYSRNTLALKEIAKKYNVFIPIICHVTKETKPYDRDPREKVRGSEKILDNCDFTICFSQLIDQYNSESPENLMYQPNYGHLKYYNKRGTGLTLNKVFYFHSQTKKIIDNAPPVEEFPTYEKFSSEFNAKQKKKAKEEFSDAF